MEKTFRFSNVHADYQARDAKSVFGWRYNPRIIFKGGKGTKLIDMDGNEYYDMSSGMMCMVLGHSHPELTEVIKEMAGSFIHQSSWYSNPWTVEFAERLTEHGYLGRCSCVRAGFGWRVRAVQPGEVLVGDQVAVGCEHRAVDRTGNQFDAPAAI